MDERTARRLLRAERERLEAIRRRVTADHLEEDQQEAHAELSSEDQHPADVGSQTFEREKDFSIIRHAQVELDEVDWALHRVDEGTFGICEACGRRIADARLRARPATRYCLEDQARAERQASAS